VEAALTPATRLVFVETIANPRVQVADLVRIGELCKARGILYVVDNTDDVAVAVPAEAALARLIVNCAHRSTSAGTATRWPERITDTGLFDWTRFPTSPRTTSRSRQKLGPAAAAQEGPARLRRHAGAEQAHHIAIGAETLACAWRGSARMRWRSRSGWKGSRSAAVYYPGLASHPQHALAVNCSAASAVSCRSSSPRHRHVRLPQPLKIVVLSSNLGDNRTLAIPVAHTIFYEMGAGAARCRWASPIRSFASRSGSRTSDDLVADFAQALRG
jgi:O-acetylhomoserine (thiol)-lyase